MEEVCSLSRIECFQIVWIYTSVEAYFCLYDTARCYILVFGFWYEMEKLNIQPQTATSVETSFSHSLETVLPNSTECLDLIEKLYWSTKSYMSGKDRNPETFQTTLGVWLGWNESSNLFNQNKNKKKMGTKWGYSLALWIR